MEIAKVMQDSQGNCWWCRTGIPQGADADLCPEGDLTTPNFSELVAPNCKKVFTLGSDPEFLASDSKGRLVCAMDSPKIALPAGFTVDGWAWEYHTPPSLCAEVFRNTMVTALNDLERQLGKRRYRVVLWRDALGISGGHPPECYELGCHPSLNAYEDYVVFPPGYEVKWRSTGCHLHFGEAEPGEGVLLRGLPKEKYKEIVWQMDATAGILGKLFETGDSQRRILYGRAGDFRIQPHGLEYRVPSGMLLGNIFGLSLVVDAARAALGMGLAGNQCYPKDKNNIRNIINCMTPTQAWEFILSHKRFYQAFFTALYGGSGKKLMRVIEESKGDMVGLMCWKNGVKSFLRYVE